MACVEAEAVVDALRRLYAGDVGAGLELEVFQKSPCAQVVSCQLLECAIAEVQFFAASTICRAAVAYAATADSCGPQLAEAQFLLAKACACQHRPAARQLAAAAVALVGPCGAERVAAQATELLRLDGCWRTAVDVLLALTPAPTTATSVCAFLGAWLGRGDDSDIIQCALRYPANIDQHAVGNVVEEAARNGLIREVPDCSSLPASFRARLFAAARTAIDSGHLEAGALILQDLPGFGIELLDSAEKLCRSKQVGIRISGVALWSTALKSLTEAQRPAAFARYVSSFFAAASRDVDDHEEDDMQTLRDALWDLDWQWRVKSPREFTLVEGALSELEQSLQNAGDWVRAEAALWVLSGYAKSKREDFAKSIEVCLVLLERLASLPGLSHLIISACSLVEVKPSFLALRVVLDRRLTDRALRGIDHSNVTAAVSSAATACCIATAKLLWDNGTAPALVEELQSRALAGEEGFVAAAAELLALKDVRPLASQWAQLCTQASSDNIASRAKAFLSTIVNLDVCAGLWVDCVSMLHHVPSEARVDFMARVAGFIVDSAGRWRNGGSESEIVSKASHLWAEIWAQTEGDVELIVALQKLVQASARTSSNVSVAMEALIRSFERAISWSPQAVDAAIDVVQASVAPAGSIWPLTRSIMASYGHVLAVAARLSERQPVCALSFIGALASWKEDSEDGMSIRATLRAQSSAVRILLEKGEDQRMAQRIAAALA